MLGEKRSVDEVLTQPSPSTVIYRQPTNSRATVKSLIDSTVDSELASTLENRPFRSESIVYNPSDVSPTQSSSNKLGWVNGVFVPCLLNIWGVIMFLRLGWVVGQAGVLLAIVIITASNVVTTITALSMSAICTNGEIKGGGAYYLISRALGPVYGGTIGILFFVAQAVATSLYVVGFAETIAIDLFNDLGVSSFTGSQINDVRVIGICISVVLLMVALIGVGWYAKCQVGLLVVLVAAMVSVAFGSFFPDIPDTQLNEEAGFVGYAVRNLEPNFQSTPDDPVEQDFFKVFAVFFPAVTGIMAGANLSGDLKDPSEAIPKGTLSAVFVTFLSYIALVLIVGFSCLDCVGDSCLYNTPNQTDADVSTFGGLVFNKLIMKNVALWAPLVYVGVVAATLSSALASLVGAPRILQSVARDELFPVAAITYFGKGHGAGDEPIRAYFLTFVINCCFVLIGQLNQIAPLISNFFMISYMFTNYACFASSQANTPAWRPAFKYYNKWLSFLGALLCFVIMFLLDWITAIITFVVGIGIYIYLLRLDPEVNWGAAGEAMRYVRALEKIEKLQLVTNIHVKTFRPQLLVLTGKPRERQWLIKFVSMLQKGRGLMICGDVVLTHEIEEEEKSNSSADHVELRIHHETAAELASAYEKVCNRRIEGDAFLADKTIWRTRCPGAFCEAVTADSVFDGFQMLLQTSGLGKMRPNTVVLGFKRNWMKCHHTQVANYEKLIRVAMSSNLGVMVVRDDKGLLDLSLRSTGGGPIPSNSCCFPRSTQRAKQVTKEEPRETAAPASKGGEEQVDESAPTANGNGGVAGANGINNGQIQKIVPHLSGDRIDVWWLVDDGGLTMLMPHLLKQSSSFRNHKLRVMTITDYATDESVKLQRTEMRMIHLLNKFRISAETKGVQADLYSAVSAETIAKFEALGTTMAELTKVERVKTLYNLRLSELVRARSHDASMVFIVLPIPETGLRVSLYTSWLHMISDGMPPTVMMRGNNENVLTLFF